MPGGGGVSAGLFTLVGVAGLPGSSPNHGLNPELAAGWGDVDSVDAVGGTFEPAEPEGSVDEVVEGLVEEVVGEVVGAVVEDVLAAAFSVLLEAAVDAEVLDVVDTPGALEVSEVFESLGLDKPEAAACVDVESSQKPGLAIVTEAATANTNAKLLAT
jgi:hypothetical protein